MLALLLQLDNLLLLQHKQSPSLAFFPVELQDCILHFLLQLGQLLFAFPVTVSQQSLQFVALVYNLLVLLLLLLDLVF